MNHAFTVVRCTGFTGRPDLLVDGVAAADDALDDDDEDDDDEGDDRDGGCGLI